MCALFRNENPNLGPLTTVAELSGFGSGQPILQNFKPGTREIIEIVQSAAFVTATGQYIFIAPWQCQVVAARITFGTAGTGSPVLNLNKIPQAGLPLAPSTAANGTTVIALLSAAFSLSSTANTTTSATSANGGLSTAAGSPLILQAGDQLAYQISGTVTSSSSGTYLQVEIAQIG
jgi:hypothetical protein